MNSLSLYRFLFLHHCLLLLSNIIYAANSPPPYVPTDYILLNCGAPPNTTSLDGRKWDTDSQPKFRLSPNISNNSTAVSIGSEKEPSVEEVPYSTARIFHSKFTYTFPLSSIFTQPTIQVIILLPMTPPNHSSLLMQPPTHLCLTSALILILIHGIPSKLLNINPWNPIKQIKQLTILKEFTITINQSRLLEVTFTPSQNSDAFVNAIEVVSIPDNFYIKGNDDDDAIKYVGQDTTGFHIDDSMALETLYRLNVAGERIPPINDSGMFRTWEKNYPITPGVKPIYSTVSIHYTLKTPFYTAPEVVYSSAMIMRQGIDYSMTWIFTVDSGFYYLLRLYFCEYQPEVTLTNQRVFFIFINNQTAEQSADVIQWSGGNGIPVYKDYVVFVQDHPDGSLPCTLTICRLPCTLTIMVYICTRMQY